MPKYLILVSYSAETEVFVETKTDSSAEIKSAMLTKLARQGIAADQVDAYQETEVHV